MSDLRFNKFWQICGYLLVASVVYLSLTSSPPDVLDFAMGDKLGHVLAYTVMTGWFGQLYLSARSQIIIAVLFCVMGILIEVLQGMSGVRFFDYFDMLANVIGVGFGWWLTRGFFQGAFVKIELLFDGTTK